MDILDLIFPKRCLQCKKGNTYICLKCLENVRNLKEICPFCLRFSFKGRTHKRCKKSLQLDGLVCAWRFKGVIKKAILALKYRFASDIVEEVSKKFTKNLKDKNLVVSKNALLIPVPLHWYRENWRGFNQAGKMAQSIAQNMGWKYIPDLIIRKKSTKSQTGLIKKERLKNVQGAFVLNPKYESKIIHSQPVIIFDDVWTTGATIKEICKVLKSNGARNVWGLTLAR